MRWPLALSVALVACGAPPPAETSAPAPRATPSAIAATSPPAPLALPPQPVRSYTASGTPVPIDTRAPPFSTKSLSPDGLLLAISSNEGLALYDVDRGMVVGRWKPDGPSASTAYIEWIGNDAILISTGGAVALVDGRTGALRSSTRGSFEGFVATARGRALAVFDGDDATKPRRLTIHPVEAPATVLETHAIPPLEGPTPGEPPAVLDTIERPWTVRPKDDATHTATVRASGDVVVTDRKTRAERVVGRVKAPYEDAVPTLGGAFIAVRTGSDTQVFAGDSPASRDALFTLKGKRCALLTGPGGALRLADCESSFYDVRGAGTSGFVPRELALSSERYGEMQGVDRRGTAFVAPCYGLPPATLGAAPATPSSRPVQDDRGREVSPDGTLRATWGPRVSDEYTERVSRSGSSTRVAIVDPDDRPLRMIDQGELVLSFAFHPSGMLVVAGVTTVKIWNPHDGKLARTLPGRRFDFGDDGRFLFVSSAKEIAIYEWASMRPVGRWTGRFREGVVSPRGTLAALRAVKHSEATMHDHDVAVHVVDLRSQRTRFIVQTADRGFAFSPDDKTFAVASIPVMEIPMSNVLASQIDLRDLVIGRAVSSVPTPSGAEKPFFLKDGAVVGFHISGGARLVRRSDGAVLDVRASDAGGQCSIYAVDAAGHFDGEPQGSLGFRLGEELRTSEVVTSGPRFEAFRKKDLIASFIDGR